MTGSWCMQLDVRSRRCMVGFIDRRRRLAVTLTAAFSLRGDSAGTPRALIEATADPDRAAPGRTFQAMMPMRKIDIAAIEAARRD